MLTLITHNFETYLCNVHIWQLKKFPVCHLLPHVVPEIFVWSLVFFTSVNLITLTFHTEVFPTSSSSEHPLDLGRKLTPPNPDPAHGLCHAGVPLGPLPEPVSVTKSSVAGYCSVGITTLLPNTVIYSYGCQTCVIHCKIAWWRLQKRRLLGCNAIKPRGNLTAFRRNTLTMILSTVFTNVKFVLNVY